MSLKLQSKLINFNSCFSTKLDIEREEEYRRLLKDWKYKEQDMQDDKLDQQKLLKQLIDQDLHFMGTADQFYKNLSKGERESIKGKQS